MKAEMAFGFRSNLAPTHVSAETFLFADLQPRVRQLSPTRCLRIEQSPSDHEQIGKSCRDLEPVQVLRQAPVTHFLEAEDPLDDAKNVLNFGAYSGLAAVRRFDRISDALTPSVASVGEVPGPRCAGADRRLLSAVSLVTPHSRFLTMEQVLQGVAIGHVGRRGQHCVDQLRTAVDSNVRFHPEVPLLRLIRLSLL